MTGIEHDNERFRQIIKGKIKKELHKYITNGELIGKKGKDLVSIPVPQIEIPHFKYGSQGFGGVGQGEGEPGDQLFPADGEEGQSEAGSLPGEHILEVDVSLDELAKMLAEELELPNIKPKGKKNVTEEKERYTGISRVGPESLRHFKRTYKEALKRQIITGTYDVLKPKIIPIKEDKRYRSWKLVPNPEASAVVIYMMDVSGSMGDEQKELVRIESFWIDTFLQSQYKDIKTVYITHDAQAREVDKHTFFHSRESGGTMISSAYELCKQFIHGGADASEHYSPDDWNIYCFHFSDGDNFGGGDTERCTKLLKENLLPAVNLFCYGQVKSPYGNGKFKKDLEGSLVAFMGTEGNFITSEILNKDGIYDSIKEFLGKGK